LVSQTSQLTDVNQRTETVKSKVIFYEFSVPPKPLDLSGAIDIDALVAEFESLSPQNSEAITKGRQWVADTFYVDTSIAKLRLERGLSQAELARQARTSQSYIARLEQGKVDPQISTVQKIAAVLGVSIEVFVQALFTETNP